MSRSTILLVDGQPPLRQHLVGVLARVPRTHLETCTSEELTQCGRALRPLAVLLAEPGRAYPADAGGLLGGVSCAALTLDPGQDRLVQALKAGAPQQFVLPDQAQDLAQWLRGVIETGPSEGWDGPRLTAESLAIRRVLQVAERVAQSGVSVFLTGETGVGKEVLAREIHRRSPRRAGPFVAVNCAAMPDTMVESILFGHDKGAFTGATDARPGKFQLADRGTLLLDEVTELPLHLQSKLLRVLQEREVEPLGARRARRVDVRVMATSNRQPRQALAERVLREDLYYRLNVFPIRIPPLRERREDILPMALEMLAEASGGRVERLDPDAVERLLAHRWPGNARELRNVMERAAVLSNGPKVTGAEIFLDDELDGWVAPLAEPVKNPSPQLGALLQTQENRMILDTLAALGGSRKDTAQRLGISPRTLRYKLARLRETGVAIPAGD